MTDQEDIVRTVESPEIVLEGEAGELIAARRRDRLHAIVIYRETGRTTAS